MADDNVEDSRRASQHPAENPEANNTETSKTGATEAGTNKAGAKKAGTDRAAQGAGPSGLPYPGDVPRPWVDGYPPHVPSSYAYPVVPVTRLLDDAVIDFPRNEAVHFLGASTSYRQLLDEVDRFAAALAALGVGKGQRVGLALPNCPQHVVAIFAALRLGAVAVEADPAAGEDELAHRLSEAACRVLVCLDPVYPRVAASRGQLPTVEHVIVTGLQDALPAVRSRLFRLRGRRDGTYHRIPGDAPVLRMTELIEQTMPAPPPVEVDPVGDSAMVLPTSGTAGPSKGVVLTHANLVANAVQTRLWIPDIRAGGENVLCVMPFCHPHGMVTGLILGVLSAATLTLLPDTDASRALETMERRRPTLLPGVPPVFAELAHAARCDERDVSSLRVALSAGGPLPETTAAAFERLTGARLREAYGLTEAGALTHANPVYGRSQPGSIGLPLPDTVCTLRDVDDPREPAPEGGPGELAVAGPQAMAGYDGHAEATAASVVDGWLLTGDVATVDGDGYFAIVDRKAALISTGSATVHPREVEQALTEHPAVERTAVAGVADAQQAGQQKVKAYVVLADDAQATDDELLSFLGERLAPHKLPRQIEFRAALPRNLAGEVMRHHLVSGERGPGA